MHDRRNVLLIVIDQLRADCVFGDLAAHVDLPNIRALAAEGVSFENHFSVAAPCGPSRASLLTGQYAMNHRSVRNGTPLRFDTPTLATEAQKAGHEPLLFGYTDTSQDPRHLPADDPRLFSYEEVAAGFTEVVRMRFESDCVEWERHLRAKGYDLPGYPDIYRPGGDSPASPAQYAAEDSDTAFLADRFLADISKRPAGWFAFLAFIRPHPPLVAPVPYNTMYDPGAMPPPRGSADAGDWHPFLAPARAAAPISGHIKGFPDFAQTPENVALLRALYFGLATEVDHHIGRIVAWLKDSGEFDNTIIVLTSDHGELLGDYGLWGRTTFHDAAFHVPLLIRDPAQKHSQGHRVAAATKSVDVMPTILELIGAENPHSVDGRSLATFLGGHRPENWRSTTFSELDFGNPLKPTVWQRQLGLPPDGANLAVLRHGRHRFVQFAADLPQILFDMEEGGETRNLAQDANYSTNSS